MIICIKPDIDASLIICASELSEHLIIKIPLGGNDVLTLVEVYKYPATSGENEVALHNILSDISNRVPHILITGEFKYKGINWIDWSTYENTTRDNCFMEAARDAYLLQHVTVRFMVDLRTSNLDLILTNDENMVDNLEVHNPLATVTMTA